MKTYQQKYYDGQQTYTKHIDIQTILYINQFVNIIRFY